MARILKDFFLKKKNDDDEEKNNKKESSKNEKDILSEFEEGALNQFREGDRKSLLSLIKNEQEEYRIGSFHDESDALIISLAGFVLAIGASVTVSEFPVPDPLFLGTAVFALYFSLVSLLKTGKLKTTLTLVIFPVTSLFVIRLINLHVDINTVNNGLSLIALSVTLWVIPGQKKKYRSQLKKNRYKNNVILKQDKIIREQDKTMAMLREQLSSVNAELLKHHMSKDKRYKINSDYKDKEEKI